MTNSADVNMFTAALLAAVVALYLYLTRTFSYWRHRGVKHDTPIPIFGTNILNYFSLVSLTQVLSDAYRKYPNEKVVGVFRSSRPILVIRNPMIVKRILITDFNYFHARGLNLHNEPLYRNVFFSDGDQWRLLRKCMTPAFTSGKLRAMFPLIAERAEKLQARALAAAPHALDARDLMARYSIDLVAACAFGLEVDSLSVEHSTFKTLVDKMYRVRYQDVITAGLKSIFPVLFKFLRHYAKVENGVHELVLQIMNQRNNKPSDRRDFIDLLMECKISGNIICESIEMTKEDGSPEQVTLEVTDELLSAQVFLFLSAGLEPSASSVSFTLHQLAFHPEVQRRAQDEVDRVLAKHGNKFTYDAINEMQYLKWALMEAMRMFPSPGFLFRKCTRKYTIPELGVEIDPGVGVVIPVDALHNDPLYFPEPDQFRPERFHPEQVDANNKYVYLPFGDGPRACIGARLGLMQSVAGLAAVLARCSVSPAPSTLRHPRPNPNGTFVQNFQKLPLMFHLRKL